MSTCPCKELLVCLLTPPIQTGCEVIPASPHYVLNNVVIYRVRINQEPQRAHVDYEA